MQRIVTVICLVLGFGSAEVIGQEQRAPSIRDRDQDIRPAPPSRPPQPSNPVPTPANPGDAYVIEFMFENTIIPLPLVFGEQQTFRGTMEFTEYREQGTRHARGGVYTEQTGTYQGAALAQRQPTHTSQIAVAVRLRVEYQRPDGVVCTFNEVFTTLSMPADHTFSRPNGCSLDLFVGADFDNASLPIEPEPHPTRPNPGDRREIF